MCVRVILGVCVCFWACAFACPCVHVRVRMRVHVPAHWYHARTCTSGADDEEVAARAPSDVVVGDVVRPDPESSERGIGWR